MQHAPRLARVHRLALLVRFLRREPPRRHDRREQRLLRAAAQPVGLLLLLLRRRHASRQRLSVVDLGHRLRALAEPDVELLQSLPQLLPPRVEEGLEALDLVRVAPLEHPLPTEARDVLVEALGRLAERLVVGVAEAEDGEVGAREDARRVLALQVAQELVRVVRRVAVARGRRDDQQQRHVSELERLELLHPDHARVEAVLGGVVAQRLGHRPAVARLRAVEHEHWRLGRHVDSDGRRLGY
mmetsp:Transcript_3281/g.8515  ORF Transcript_3281/g.8515 Transcript_3281/m.8515 type:complete len:242 (-) Transcript_3281:8-733(-)